MAVRIRAISKLSYSLANMYSEYKTDPSDALPSKPTFALHKVGSVVLATFFGTPIAGGIVMAVNFFRLGRSQAAGVTIFCSVLVTIGVILAAFMLPELGPTGNLVYVVPQLILAGVIANAFQGEEIQQHIRQGGRVVSAWIAFLIGLATLPFAVVLMFGLAFLLPEELVTEGGYRTATFGEDEVLYRGEATEADARRLAVQLREQDFFDGTGYSAILDINGEVTSIGFVVVDNAWKELGTCQYYQSLGEALTSSFGTPLTIELFDEDLHAQKTMIVN